MDFSWLTNFISSAIDRLIGLLQNLLIDLCNLLISAIASAGVAVIDLLPTASSLPSNGSFESSFLGVVNWFLPVNGLVDCLAFYFAGYLLYMASAPLLRWFKVVR